MNGCRTPLVAVQGVIMALRYRYTILESIAKPLHQNIVNGLCYRTTTLALVVLDLSMNTFRKLELKDRSGQRCRPT